MESRCFGGKKANHELGTLPWCIRWLACISVGSTMLVQGSSTDKAAVRKTAKYTTLPDSRTFHLVAFETLGPINQTGEEFLAELGHGAALQRGHIQRRFSSRR
jgi:hypothetical protein